MMKKLVLILVVIIALTSLQLSSISAYPNREFVLNSATWSRLPAGENGVAVLKLEVAYYGEEALLDVTAKLALEHGSVMPPDTTTIGSWNPGTVKVLTFLVNTSDVYGEYTAILYINYGGIARQRRFGYEVVKTQGRASISFKLRFYGNPSISALISPSTIVGDSVNVLTIILKNTGTGDALDFSATISFTGAALLDVEEPLKLRVDKLQPGESLEVAVSLIPFSPQVSINVEADYVDAYGNVRVDRLSIVVPSATGTAIVVLAEPSKLRAGSSNEVFLEVKNIGDSTLKDAFLQIQIPQNSQVVVEPQFIELGDLKPRESRRYKVVISVPSTAMGAQNIAYSLTYESEQGAKITVRDSFSVFVVEQAQLAITSVEIVPSKPKVGETVIVSLTLINLGSQALNKVNVTVEASEGLQPLRKTYYFLGQIQPQAPTSIPFSFKALSRGKQIITFKVVCEDVYGVEWTTTRVLEVEILEAESSTSGGEANPYEGYYIYLIAVLIAIISIASILYFYKKRRG